MDQEVAKALRSAVSYQGPPGVAFFRRSEEWSTGRLWLVNAERLGRLGWYVTTIETLLLWLLCLWSESIFSPGEGGSLDLLLDERGVITATQEMGL